MAISYVRAIIGTAVLWATAVLLLTSTVSRVNSAANIPQAPVGHRQPTAQDVQSVQDDNSADQTMKKIDEDLKKKLNGICRGC
jgi:formate-dependent phosphoribosylglycinamide formyltransferase (GAR transformylase)